MSQLYTSYLTWSKSLTSPGLKFLICTMGRVVATNRESVRFSLARRSEIAWFIKTHLTNVRADIRSPLKGLGEGPVEIEQNGLQVARTV